MDTLPTPPAEIQYHPIDLNNPLHAKAYLKAASHFLSSWPQDWSAEKLFLALIADEEDTCWLADRQKIVPWEAISKYELHPMDDSDPWNFVEDLINGLAEDFLIFLSENA